VPQEDDQTVELEEHNVDQALREVVEVEVAGNAPYGD
jgi:hypothetical protein